MQTPPIPQDEESRLKALHDLAILDTAPEERFDILTRQASKALDVPICIISIIDRDREWYKSCQGVSIREQDRSISFCGHALLAKSLFMVEDTLLDPRFSDNPTVVGKPFIRFYAGIALLHKETGLPMGVFCIKDIRPRKLSVQEVALFMEYAARAEEELNKTKELIV